MKIKVFSAFICLILIILSCGILYGQQQIPQESMDKLQDTFSLLRDDLWEQTDVFWHRGEYDRCVATCRLITQIDPHDIEAYDDAAWLMQNSFHDDQAEAFLLEGLKQNSDSFKMYFYVGYFYYMHIRFEDAIKYFEQANCYDAPFYVRHMLAHAYEYAGYTDEAFDLWTQAEDADPSDPVPQNQILRIMQGKPNTKLPYEIYNSRKERQKEESNSQQKQ